MQNNPPSPIPNPQLISKAIRVLKRGGVIAFPTDTVYGIGCDAFNERAVKKIYELKKRNIKKPLIMFIGKKSELKKYVYIPPVGRVLIKKFWPGGLTIVFRSRNKVPLWVGKSTCSYPTLSVRIPSAEPILTLLRQYNRPIATTSANLEGFLTPINDEEIKLKVDFIIPGVSNNIPSTIIDISSTKPAILREGQITSEQIYKVLQMSGNS